MRIKNTCLRQLVLNPLEPLAERCGKFGVAVHGQLALGDGGRYCQPAGCHEGQRAGIATEGDIRRILG